MASLNKTSASPSNDSLRSWLAVFGASLALFCTVGFLNAFGVFQQYYEKSLLRGKSASNISWIGSVSIFLLYLGGPFAGILVDKLGPRPLLLFGSAGLLLSIFMTSLCTQYYQFFLAQSVLLGGSMSLIFCPSVAIVSRRMAHRRGLALGLTIGGSSIGGVIWPVMLDQLLFHDKVSFGSVMRIVGFTMLPLLGVVCLLVVDEPSTPQTAAAETIPKPGISSDKNETKTSFGELPSRTNAAERGPCLESSDGASISTESKHVEKLSIFDFFKDSSFALLCASMAFTYLGLFTPFFYVSPYATSLGTTTPTAFYLVAAVNASSLFGRVIPGYLADRFGHFNICILAVAASSLVGYCWTTANELAGLIVWSLAYGFTSGAVISLQSACAGKFAPPKYQGTAVGLVTGAVAISALVGAPIGGAILPYGGYLALGLWTGSTLLLGSFFLAAARFRKDLNIFVAF